MPKKLGEMSFEELGQLFPIIIKKHDPTLSKKYIIEKENILNALGLKDIARINHIGSTCIPDLLAKPTIDVLLEIKDDADTEKLKNDLMSIGYMFSSQPDNPPPHMMFMKGYTLEGFKGQAYHVHVRYLGDWDELYFRDYLKLHPETAKEYGKLKLELKEKYEHDREGYTNSKTDFIRRITTLARKEFGRKF